MRRQPEKIVQAHICQLLRSIGARVYVLGTHRRRGDYPGTMMTAGLPDVLAFLPRPKHAPSVGERRLLAVECKAAGGRLRPEQVEFRDLCRAAQIDEVSGDLDAVIAWLIAESYLTSAQVPHYRHPTTAESHI